MSDVERMSISARPLTPSDAEAASALVRSSFMEIAARDWEPHARSVFLIESSPAHMAEALTAPAFAAAAFEGQAMLGLILLRKPSVLDMLFVHPGALRRGIARQLWEQARAHLERSFPEVKTVELNSTPNALSFYRAMGFVPISAELERDGCRATRMACRLAARAPGAEAH